MQSHTELSAWLGVRRRPTASRVRRLCLAVLAGGAALQAPATALANDFWGGAAAGVGSTLLFDRIREARRERELEDAYRGPEYVYTQPPLATPPPHPADESIDQRLVELKNLCDQRLLTPEECNEKRQQILNTL